MKVYDAVVTVRYKVSNVMNEQDEADGLEFEALVRDLIDSEGLLGIVDDDDPQHPAIVSIAREVREE